MTNTNKSFNKFIDVFINESYSGSQLFLKSYIKYLSIFPYFRELLPLENAEYSRVIPRDFFNESKLLKSLGRLSLLIHDNVTKQLQFKQVFDNKAFQIAQDIDGNLIVLNYFVYCNDKPLILYSKYNSKEAYPLYINTEEYETYLLFDEQGNFTLEAIQFLSTNNN